MSCKRERKDMEEYQGNFGLDCLMFCKKNQYTRYGKDIENKTKVFN